MNLTPSKEDTYIWMRMSEGQWKYITIYVDDLIVAAKKYNLIIGELRKTGNFELKGVWKPEYYLGTSIIRNNDPNLKYRTLISAKRVSKMYVKGFNVCLE